MSPLLSVAAAQVNGNVGIHRGYRERVDKKPAYYRRVPMESYFGKYNNRTAMIRERTTTGTTK